MRIAGILLASGRSERFGKSNKLLAEFRGASLVTYAAAALRAVGPEFLIAVTQSDRVAALLPGFEIVRALNEKPAHSDSLRAGIAAARQYRATHALIVLGDMPNITADHLQNLLDCSATTKISASTDGSRRMVPACFPSEQFQALMSLSGDLGARHLLSDIPSCGLVKTSPDVLVDINSKEDLQAAV